MIDFQTHNCPACREQFVAACESELQEKLKKHKSSCTVKAGSTKRTNKKRERTRQLYKQRIALSVHDTVVNSIEKHNFTF